MKKDNERQERFCADCEFSVPAPLGRDGDTFICRKKGMVSWDYRCHRFKYDILKRDPKHLPDLPQVERIDLDN